MLPVLAVATIAQPSLHPAAEATPRAIGLLLALYNANVTTDWVTVANAAKEIPVRVIIPVPGVSPPDPDWAPTYPKSAGAYVKNGHHTIHLQAPACARIHQCLSESRSVRYASVPF